MYGILYILFLYKRIQLQHENQRVLLLERVVEEGDLFVVELRQQRHLAERPRFPLPPGRDELGRILGRLAALLRLLRHALHVRERPPGDEESIGWSVPRER